MADIFVTNNFYQGTSSACIVDVTPPTFAGITFLDVESRGQIRAGWSAATDPVTPIRYEVYIKASTATGLFNTANIIAVTPNLQYDIFTLPDGSFLVNGTTYYVGVRAIDGVSNRETNTVSMSVISTGVLTTIDVYECHAVFSDDENNDFRITMWADKNESIAVSPDAVLGTASYQVYDKAGSPVVGMSGSGIAADSNGLFVAPAIPNLLDTINNHYEIKVSIVVDGETRVNFIKVDESTELYTIDGTADLDDSNDLIGSFWISRNTDVVTTDISNGSYYVYTADGTYTGISETGITPDVNGFFVITPFALPPTLDETKSYVIKLIAEVDGTTLSTYIKLGDKPVVYENKATFSINASNQLEATFWAVKNNQLVDPTILGTAAYQVYDKTGATVAGLNQSGIIKDANGFYHITPVSAVLLSDLTHYTVKVTISIAGSNKTSMKGFTLLGN